MLAHLLTDDELERQAWQNGDETLREAICRIGAAADELECDEIESLEHTIAYLKETLRDAIAELEADGETKWKELIGDLEAAL